MASKTGCADCAENEALSADFDNVQRGDAPSNWWHCGTCDRHLERYRGQSDVPCDCGAEYNSGGQRLRDDWRRNPSLYDESIGDLDGFEIAHARDE